MPARINRQLKVVVLVAKRRTVQIIQISHRYPSSARATCSQVYLQLQVVPTALLNHPGFPSTLVESLILLPTIILQHGQGRIRATEDPVELDGIL